MFTYLLTMPDSQTFFNLLRKPVLIDTPSLALADLDFEQIYSGL